MSLSDCRRGQRLIKVDRLSMGTSLTLVRTSPGRRPASVSSVPSGSRVSVNPATWPESVTGTSVVSARMRGTSWPSRRSISRRSIERAGDEGSSAGLEAAAETGGEDGEAATPASRTSRRSPPKSSDTRPGTIALTRPPKAASPASNRLVSEQCQCGTPAPEACQNNVMYLPAMGGRTRS